MAPNSKIQNDKRKKLLNRFYEPLVLLFVLDRTQGDHLARPTSERLPLDGITEQELRRRYLDALSYLCDFEKGGDTTTSILLASAPLTYFVSCNKSLNERVEPFLQTLLTRLESVYKEDHGRCKRSADEILRACVGFSEKRLTEYWKLLQSALEKCRGLLSDDFANDNLSTVAQKLAESGGQHYDLCRRCDLLMKSTELNYIKQRAMISEANGNRENPFAELRHFIGRFAYHPKCVRVLISAAQRIPALFLQPHIEPVRRSLSLVPSPPLRSEVTLDGIAKRMISHGETQLLQEIQERLKVLDQSFDIMKTFREEYAGKNIKPCVHAELILLEHFYQNRDHIELFHNDRFIGCSKPACYCCFLYIREHPGHFVEPATHQKLYLNWMPPTSVTGVQEPQSELGMHERVMLNKMVVGIRARTIDQIKSQSGRRKKQFDSVTGETFSAPVNPESRISHRSNISHSATGFHHNQNDIATDVGESLASRLDSAMNFTASDEDSDGGGVHLV